MSNVHIFTAPSQPAMRFLVSDEPRIWVRHKPRTPVFVGCCMSWRWAKYARVQVYYDSIRYWCAPGHGCKHA